MDKNLITIFLYCGGADGCGILLNREYLTYIEYGYDIAEVLTELFEKIDMKKEVTVREVDVDEYLPSDALEYFSLILEDDPEEEHNKLSYEEVDALLEGNIEKFARLFNERCGGKIDGEDN